MINVYPLSPFTFSFLYTLLFFPLISLLPSFPFFLPFSLPIFSPFCLFVVERRGALPSCPYWLLWTRAIWSHFNNTEKCMVNPARLQQKTMIFFFKSWTVHVHLVLSSTRHMRRQEPSSQMILARHHLSWASNRSHCHPLYQIRHVVSFV